MKVFPKSKQNFLLQTERIQHDVCWLHQPVIGSTGPRQQSLILSGLFVLIDLSQQANLASSCMLHVFAKGIFHRTINVFNNIRYQKKFVT